MRWLNWAKSCEHFEGSPQRPLGVIFVLHRRAEERHDLIADVFVDGASVFFHDGNQIAEAFVDGSSNVFGISSRRVQ